MLGQQSKTKMTDIADKAFISAYQNFINRGDFIAITRQFEQGYKQTGYENTLNFRVDKATVYLLDTGVLAIEPDQNNNVVENTLTSSSIATPETAKNIVISSGIHGNETAPIEIVQQLVSQIITKKIKVKQRCLFIIGNPVAMNLAKRFHTENLNRLFNGKYQSIASCYETFRAEKLECYLEAFFKGEHISNNRYHKEATNYHYDLHTAIRASKYDKFAIYPYRQDGAWDKEQLSFMASCGVSTVLLGHAPSGTFSYFSSANFSAHAFTVELGKVKTFGENNMDDFIAISEQLKSVISGNKLSLKVFSNLDFKLFTVISEIIKTSDNFSLLIDDDASNFTHYPINTLLSTDNMKEYRTQQVGESIVFPNANVGLNQRAALIVIPTTLD